MTVIVGRILASANGNGPIVVAAVAEHPAGNRVFYTVVHGSGEYELMVERGSYNIFAYRDRNSNLIYEPDEPAGQHNRNNLVQVTAGGVIHDVDIVIPDTGGAIDIPYGFRISEDVPPRLYSRQAGDIADLDDDRFADQWGQLGFWEPGAFFSTFGGNIYFLEPYDPEKIPILFIHGAGGTPRGWRSFVENLDRKQYQPWFFYYPTGARIDSVAYGLFWKLLNLQMKYHFSDLYITAHSMGGLVARSFLVNHGRQFPSVSLLVTLATPWAGDQMAEYGVRQSPVVVPSWVDMQPDGDFIRSLYREKLPESVQFYMFVGYRGNRNPFQSNNDGTISLSSLLDSRSQADAVMNFAFDEDHASIAFSKEVLTQFKTILDEHRNRSKTPTDRQAGHLKVRFTYRYETGNVHPRPMLVLSPANRGRADIVVYLEERDNGKTLGPFPAGDYFASLVASATGGKPDRTRIPVTIESGKTKEIEVNFSPEGILCGCVSAPEQPADLSIGLPGFQYRSRERAITIRSLQLRGRQIDREPPPVRGPYLNDNSAIISRQDYCYNECFCFFNLPEGRYALTLTADGYLPLHRAVQVSSGAPAVFERLQLKAE